MIRNGDTEKLEHFISGLTERSTATAVGRAATGLFALLSLWKKDNTQQKIALPSFLCQSPLAAVLLSGWEPEFCEIDPDTGNVPLSEWFRVVDNGVNAILFVHLFGNVGNAKYVADLCKERDIYFIEDAAQSLGGSWEGIPCGSVGDASLISFGHTKLIDVGSGGMILTNDPLLATEVRKFECNSIQDEVCINSISKDFKEKYYKARDFLVDKPEIAKHNFKGLINIYTPLIKRKWRAEAANVIRDRLNSLDLLVQKRKKKFEIYQDLLRNTELIPLTMSNGSVPWRAVFRLPNIDWAKQNSISEAVRSEGIDISNWYLPSHWMMRDINITLKNFSLTEKLSKEIFQLWLDDDTTFDKVKYAASVLIREINDISDG